MMKPMMRIDTLSKGFATHMGFRRREALIDVSFDLIENEVLGVVGHNGAGKTTLFKILMGLMAPGRGEVAYGPKLGSDPREKIGFLPEAPYFYAYLTAGEALHFYGRLFGMDTKRRVSRVDDLLGRVGLAGSVGTPLHKFSKGMLQRFGVAQALLNDPELIILDEPMSGLDPSGRRDIMDIIRACRDAGKTILFSSHILGDVEAICDRVVVFDHGRIVDEINRDDMVRASTVSVLFEGASAATELEGRWQMPVIPQGGGRFRIDFGGGEDIHQVLKYLMDHGGILVDIERKNAKLASIFNRHEEEGPVR